MQNIKEKFKYLLTHFLSPKEILLLVLCLCISSFFFLVFLYKETNLFTTERILYTGKLTEGVIGNPKNSNPYKLDSQIDKDVSKLLFATLIKNLDGDKFDLGIASRVEMDSNKTTYKVTLRDNVTFSDGTPITTDDILYSLSFVPLDKNYEVTKGENNVLTFKLKKDSQNNFLENFTYPIVSKKEAFEKNFSADLITSSFFKIQNVSRDSDGNITRISLKRYNNGEEKIPYIKDYEIVFYKTEVDAYNAFQRKEVDLLSGIPGNTLSKIKDDTNIKLDTTLLPNNFAVFLNQNKDELLQDADFRQALSDSIDRESLNNQVLGSFGIPEKNILGQNEKVKTPDEIIKNLPSRFYFEDGVLYIGTKKTPQKNASKLKEDPNKTKVRIQITTIQNTELVETAKFIQNSWKKIGIETDIKIIDKKDLSSVVKERDFETLLFGYSIKNAKDYYSFFSSKERNYPKLNISNYTSKDADKVLESLTTEDNESKISDLLNRLSNYISQDNPVIVLYKPKFVFAHFLKTQIKLPSTVKGEEERYSYVEFWYTDTEKVLPIFNNLRLIDKLDTILY